MNKCTVSIKLKNNPDIEITHEKQAFFIEGGGTKGIYALGVLKYLFEDNPYIKLDSVKIFGGTSVGSFLAMALSLGYNCDDMMNLSKVINISTLVDSKCLLPVSLLRLQFYGYLYSDTGRENIVEEIIKYKINTINQNLSLEKPISAKDLTFGHLKILIQKYPDTYKDLIINTVDISRNKEIFMTTLNDNWTNIKLYDAVLASSAIPYVFKPTTIYYYPELDQYGYENLAGSTINKLVDGGVSTNNPLDYFLLNHETYADYHLWLLKFTGKPTYTKIDGSIDLMKQLADYLISGKNQIKMILIREEYAFNCVNLHLDAGTLEIYTQAQIQEIITDIYQQCVSGEIHFD